MNRIRCSLTDEASKEDKPLNPANRGKVRQNPQPIRNPLMSIAVDLNITQLVDGRKGVHAMLPKSIFVSNN